MPDGRPPRPSSKTTNSSNGKNGVPKSTRSKPTSGLHQPSKPSIKPKPTAISAASPSRRTLSRSSSAQTTECKSPGLKHSSRPKTPKSKLPVQKLTRSSSLQTATVTNAATNTAATEFKGEEISASPKNSPKDNASKMNSCVISQVKKSPNGSMSPINKSRATKVDSPKISRRQFSSVKSTSTTKSAIKTPSRSPSVPVPTKPKPPPVVVPKPAPNGTISNKSRNANSAAKSLVPAQQSNQVTSTTEQKEVVELSESEEIACKKTNQNTLSSNKMPSVTKTILDSKEKVVEPNSISTLDEVRNSEGMNQSSTDNSSEDIYDDIIQVSDTTLNVCSEINSAKDDALSNNEVNHSTNDTDDSLVHLGENIATKSTTTSDSLPSNDSVEVTNSNNSGIKLPYVSSQPTEKKHEQNVNESSPIALEIPQQSQVSLLTVSQTKEEHHTAVCNDDDIYDDVVLQNTVTVSMQENLVNVCKGDQAVSTSTATTMEISILQISKHEQSLSVEMQSISTKSNEPSDNKVGRPSRSPSPHQQTQLIENEAFYDEIVYPTESELLQNGQQETVIKANGEEFQVLQLSESPRQRRVASFQRAGDKDFGYRDSGLGIEAYYDKIGHSNDIITEPAFYDEIGGIREQLEAISSTEDLLQSESSTENVLVITDIEPPALPPRSEDMIEEINQSKSNLIGTLLEASTKAETTVESGFEDQWFDGYYNEASKHIATRITSKVKSEPLVVSESCDNSPPPLPPRRPHSTQLDAGDVPLRSSDYSSQRASSGSPQLPLVPQRKFSAPILPASPKDFVSSNSSLTPSHSAVSIISGRSEDRNATDGGSDISVASNLLDAGGEFAATEHKKEKSRFSLGFFTRKRSDKKKKTDAFEDYENVRPRASSVGQSLHRQKSSRQAMKKKGSVPPELQYLPSETEYSLPDPIHFADDKEYDDCTVIKNNWKSPPADLNPVSNNFNTDTASYSTSTTIVSLNDVGPELQSVNEDGALAVDKENNIKKSTESLGSFTQNFEDSSGWFDDIYDMVANSTTISGISNVKLTVTADNSEDIYDAVAPDIPDKNKLVVSESPNLNKRVSSSYDSSGSFDSVDEDEDDHLSPLHSDLSDTLKGRSLPQRPLQKVDSPPARPRSYSQDIEFVKHVQSTRDLRPIEDIKEVSIYSLINYMH